MRLCYLQGPQRYFLNFAVSTPVAPMWEFFCFWKRYLFLSTESVALEQLFHYNVKFQDKVDSYNPKIRSICEDIKL